MWLSIKSFDRNETFFYKIQYFKRQIDTVQSSKSYLLKRTLFSSPSTISVKKMKMKKFQSMYYNYSQNNGNVLYLYVCNLTFGEYVNNPLKYEELYTIFVFVLRKKHYPILSNASSNTVYFCFNTIESYFLLETNWRFQS